MNAQVRALVKQAVYAHRAASRQPLEKVAVPLKTMQAVAKGLKSGRFRLFPHQLPGNSPALGAGWGSQVGDKRAIREWIRALLGKTGNTAIDAASARKLKGLFAPADPIRARLDVAVQGKFPGMATKVSDRIRSLLTLFGENGKHQPLRFADDVISARNVGQATRSIAARARREAGMLGGNTSDAATLIDALNRGRA